MMRDYLYNTKSLTNNKIRLLLKKKEDLQEEKSIQNDESL